MMHTPVPPAAHRRLVTLVARGACALVVLALTGCSLDKTVTPPLTGPSEFGLALALSATPDTLTQDGRSLALVEVRARDAANAVVRGLTLRADLVVDGRISDLGTLSSKLVTTDGDGRASVVYVAPEQQGADTVVAVLFTPVGSNYANATPRDVKIRLAQPGPVLPANRAPVPSFYFSPTAPRPNDLVFFDGAASSDPDGSVVLYQWSFGDGGILVTTSATTTHTYESPGTYLAVLTVTDNAGRTAATTPTSVPVTIVSSASGTP